AQQPELQPERTLASGIVGGPAFLGAEHRQPVTGVGAGAVEQSQFTQHRAGARLVLRAHHPHRRHRFGARVVAVAEVAAQPALVRAPLGDRDLDALVAEQGGDAFDVFQPRAAEDLAHRYAPGTREAAAASATTRIRPSCAELATSLPARS